jgi:hypothetical protein
MIAMTLTPAMETAVHILRELAALAFLWLPLVFAGYAIGRRQVGLRFVFIAISIEAVALAYFAYLLKL